MRRKRQENLERSQESVSYTSDDILKSRTGMADRIKYYDEFYPRMFIEDVKFRIMPIGGRVSNKEFNISLEPPDQKIQKIVENAISPDRYHHDLAGIICDFIANHAVHLLIYETVTYEIVYLSEPKDGKIVGFELVQINPYTLVKHKGTLFQYLPCDPAKKLSERDYKELNSERIITFKLPLNIREKLDPIMESMLILSKISLPDFFMDELAAGLKKTPFDVTTHYHLKNVALAKITKDFGWNARNSFEKEASEYYLTYRHLKFQKFMIELRNSILDTLNAGLELAGKQLGFNTKILITGLPTLDDILTAYNHLLQGDIPFVEVIEPFQGY